MSKKTKKTKPIRKLVKSVMARVKAGEKYWALARVRPIDARSYRIFKNKSFPRGGIAPAHEVVEL